VEDRESLVGLIQFLASSTHVQGMSAVGTSYCCRDCGAHAKDHQSPCRRCGSQSICEITRKLRETSIKLVRH
jgi:predicted Zn-ribbon and HTH transcriptional regulator